MINNILIGTRDRRQKNLYVELDSRKLKLDDWMIGKRNNNMKEL